MSEITLDLTPHVWSTGGDISAALKHDLQNTDMDKLPLQAGLRQSSAVLDKAIEVVVLDISSGKDFLDARAGIFYEGIVAGCNCADDPGVPEGVTEYCEIRLRLHHGNRRAQISLAGTV